MSVPFGRDNRITQAKTFEVTDCSCVMLGNVAKTLAAKKQLCSCLIGAAAVKADGAFDGVLDITAIISL